jgi:orotidine-5'-phosphate decarboxylase
LELFAAEGPRALEPLQQRGKNVFLDLKLHDIPRTVAHAVSSAAACGAQLLTIHACGGRAMMAAAAEAAACSNIKLVAVTTLTSLSQDDFNDLGIGRSVADQALALGDLAIDAGVHGLVTSVHEAAALRERLGPAPLLVTPGIRPSGGAVGDQKRVATPSAAVAAGSSYLVVGRPILEADDPAAAAVAILEEMRSAL